MGLSIQSINRSMLWLISSCLIKLSLSAEANALTSVSINQLINLPNTDSRFIWSDIHQTNLIFFFAHFAANQELAFGVVRSLFSCCIFDNTFVDNCLCRTEMGPLLASSRKPNERLQVRTTVSLEAERVSSRFASVICFRHYFVNGQTKRSKVN